VAGHADIRHQRRGGQLRSGQLSLVDLSEPFSCRHSTERIVALTVPKKLVPLRPQDVSRVTGHPLRASTGAARLLAGMLRDVLRHLDSVDPQSRARLGTALVDLLTATIAPLVDLDPHPEDSSDAADAARRALLLRIHQYVEERLPAPELGPAEIAAAHHISLRYLHRLFESEELSVARHIRQRRLEACRRDLIDTTLRFWSVSMIASRWGFGSDAHFSRVFRAAYGMTPGEFRRTYQAD
jgi:AraC-like DNA-binding protein